jgi:hypothetical protein
MAVVKPGRSNLQRSEQARRFERNNAPSGLVQKLLALSATLKTNVTNMDVCKPTASLQIVPLKSTALPSFPPPHFFKDN